MADEDLDLLEVIFGATSDASTEDLAAFLAATPAFGPSQRKRRYQEPKAEIAYLRTKRDDLLAQLRALQPQQDVAALSPWQVRATEQAQLAQRSLQENVRLRGYVQDQLRVIAALENVLAKRPRLAAFASHEADRSVLGALHRESTLEQLVQREFDRIDSVYVRHGLYGMLATATPVRRAYVQSTDDMLQLSVLTGMIMDFPMAGTADLIWADKTGVKPNSTVLATIHTDLVYVKEVSSATSHAAVPPLEAHMAVRRYTFADRIAIVWRSVLEDTECPHAAENWVDNRSGWIVVHATDDKDTCYLQGYITQTTPIVPDAQPPIVGGLSELFLTAWQSNLSESWHKLDVKSSRAWLSDMHTKYLEASKAAESSTS
ncbi:hypothetical protein SDRG_14002 [Saprolegnia diclina VS20]|uniref:START domain-containing protein n=1 Tax=Saprolegnia diclina (strain VS20) TaxID=1156394 RepID=T0REW1_SAPDV|nr:hypothetical protein SDRG_14002 [Saprolegnia diclina VS20]EQC28177.1 hypothetical protein SDRG_14002 [Saprolegnia diclina VS20]|eukprot:XP_008618326.1 hypothetical protein SDRG_14002 [Saprolegnia diclina VS20]